MTLYVPTLAEEDVYAPEVTLSDNSLPYALPSEVVPSPTASVVHAGVNVQSLPLYVALKGVSEPLALLGVGVVLSAADQVKVTLFGLILKETETDVVIV